MGISLRKTKPLACYVVFRKTKRHKKNGLKQIWSPLSNIAVLDPEGRPIHNNMTAMHMSFEAATNRSILTTVEVVRRKNGSIHSDGMGGFLQRSKEYLVLDAYHMPSKQFDRLNQTTAQSKT